MLQKIIRPYVAQIQDAINNNPDIDMSNMEPADVQKMNDMLCQEIQRGVKKMVDDISSDKFEDILEKFNKLEKVTAGVDDLVSKVSTEFGLEDHAAIQGIRKVTKVTTSILTKVRDLIKALPLTELHQKVLKRVETIHSLANKLGNSSVVTGYFKGFEDEATRKAQEQLSDLVATKVSAAFADFCVTRIQKPLVKQMSTLVASASTKAAGKFASAGVNLLLPRN